MDKIIIEGLRVEALIGVYDWERDTTQALVVDAELYVDLQIAADSDLVADTVDYAKVAALLQLVAKQSQYELLEALTQQMMLEVMQRFAVAEICLRLSKPAILPDADNVAICMHRTREQYADKLIME